VIGSTRQLSVYAMGEPVDMRKGFDGLSALVSNHLHKSPVSGDLFLFVSRDRKRAKVLVWDGTGLCVYAKRLERGRFACVWDEGSGRSLKLTMTELQLFLEGSDLVGRVTLSPAALL
jgi:transposase